MKNNFKVEAPLAQMLMNEALIEARNAAAINEVPVGAVLWYDGNIIARAHNLSESVHQASAHAEHLAIDEASKKLGRWRLDDVVLAITLEPCTMCAGLIRQARIPTVIFGAMDERAGACGSLYDVLADERLGGPVRVIREVMATESAQVLKDFFETLRAK
jgi:tRNA(adenine34) deaminase